MKLLIGLDIGTTAIKGVLMTETGKILKTVSGGYHYIVRDNKKLLDPAEFTDVCLSVIHSLAACAPAGDAVAAICSCCASGNLILLDRENRPITPIIGWQTTVSAEDRDAFFSKEEQQAFYKTVGWPLSAHFPALYLAEIKLHEPQLLDKAETVAMSAEYLNFQLTGKWGLTVSMGTPSYLLDQEKERYNEPLLRKLGVADKSLPPVFDKGTVLGNVLPDMAEKLNLSPETAVVLGTFDHPSGAMGAGVFDEGEMLLSCGTSWVEFFPVPSRAFAISTGGLVDRFMLNGAPYCVMKSIASISEKIDALRRQFLGEITHREFDELAQKAPFGCNGLRFTFTEEDRAIDTSCSKSDAARAIIESAAFKLKGNLAALEQSGLKADKVTMIGGISNSPVCVGIVSEVLEKPISVVNGQCAGAAGSCMLAGIGIGLYRDERDAFARFAEERCAKRCRPRAATSG